MESVKVAGSNSMEKTHLSTIMIAKRGEAVEISWRIVGFWDDIVVIDPRLLTGLEGELSLTLSPKSTPT